MTLEIIMDVVGMAFYIGFPLYLMRRNNKSDITDIVKGA